MFDWQALVASATALGVLGFAVYSAGHAVIYKRDTRAVIAWVGLIMLLPLLGSILYWLLGVNRIARQAKALRHDGLHRQSSPVDGATLVPERWRRLARAGDALSPFNLQSGHRLQALINGEQAYPAMLQAIGEARAGVCLSTYIFDHDPAGEEFIEALVAAAARGVAVRVLIDGVGARYSRRSVVRELRQRGVPAQLFLPMHLPRTLAVFNLRNHRKLLIVDGSLGFTGGMNIREGHRRRAPYPYAIQDVQFRVEGPAVAQMQTIFNEDWHFSCGEHLTDPAFFPPLEPVGEALVRGVVDGPDEHRDPLRQFMHTAVGEARERVVVMTPYFLPDDVLMSALNAAALRGVRVDILLPARNNHVLVHWASQALHWQLLERGCRIWFTPPPFDHTKLLLVDCHWLLMGSANWDPRSLRLNFEFDMECYDADLGRELSDWVDQRLTAARRLTLQEADQRSLPIRLRDGTARLLTPYL
ncbi:phospholipase D-like domain-containing protein [Ectothiorhodospira variabilis]|uniref:phospholipase D-like domain-containing protein n=1 Tax=Ectothiorhodospira variabilis TaxID=505694 RepID=UPI001EFBDA2F|nr:phospholipase D-like domain-containing protein [Ectothiorhodospira variabilis]MCG5496400.1 phospholipase D-like domain-containing protein [Ectothiorhodospira variabilis]